METQTGTQRMQDFSEEIRVKMQGDTKTLETQKWFWMSGGTREYGILIHFSY